MDKYGETTAVVYEHTKRTQEMLFADWAQYCNTNYFLSPIRSQHSLDRFEMVR